MTCERGYASSSIEWLVTCSQGFARGLVSDIRYNDESRKRFLEVSRRGRQRDDEEKTAKANYRTKNPSFHTRTLTYPLVPLATTTLIR